MSRLNTIYSAVDYDAEVRQYEVLHCELQVQGNYVTVQGCLGNRQDFVYYFWLVYYAAPFQMSSVFLRYDVAQMLRGVFSARTLTSLGPVCSVEVQVPTNIQGTWTICAHMHVSKGFLYRAVCPFHNNVEAGDCNIKCSMYVGMRSDPPDADHLFCRVHRLLPSSIIYFIHL